MPSSTPALVAFRASSILNFLSFSSVSVAAPTCITATPPVSFASLSWSFSLSKSDDVSAIWFLMNDTLATISSFSPAPPTITVFSLSTLTVLAVPSISIVASFKSYPSSSANTVPPVKVAISSIISFLRSPKPGAFTATQSNDPLSLFNTNVANASPSTSSAMMTSFLPACATCSNNGRIS